MMKRKFVSVFILFVPLLVISSCMKSENVPSFQEQLDKDLNTIDEYLAANSITAQQDVDGYIRYVIHKTGSGASPTIDDCVVTRYTGKLLKTGSVFDNGGGVAQKFPLQRVIDGWKIGIPLMHVGDSATFYIPSGMGYGYRGTSGIPPNANLVFGVELQDIRTYNASTGSCN